ncbi:MAG: hypothetical protein IPK80_36225 [Nannocystis sp.]|nr:hypothetical protein [Nannocystis sp.]
MLRLNSTQRAIFVTVLVACNGDDGGSATATTGDTTTSATEASTSSGSTTETTTTGSTTDDVTTTGSTTDDVTTTGVTPQPCEQDECVYGHSIEGEGGLPGAICQNLLWTCAFPSPCPAVQIDPVTPKVADVDAATCAVQAMMAADRAVITLPGLGTDSGALFIVGDGTAMIQWNESARRRGLLDPIGAAGASADELLRGLPRRPYPRSARRLPHRRQQRHLQRRLDPAVVDRRVHLRRPRRLRDRALSATCPPAAAPPHLAPRPPRAPEHRQAAHVAHHLRRIIPGEQTAASGAPRAILAAVQATTR